MAGETTKLFPWSQDAGSERCCSPLNVAGSLSDTRILWQQQEDLVVLHCVDGNGCMWLLRHRVLAQLSTIIPRSVGASYRT